MDLNLFFIGPNLLAQSSVRDWISLTMRPIMSSNKHFIFRPSGANCFNNPELLDFGWI